MISIIDSGTTALLSMALDATTLRQQAIAHNIANANTPDYRPVGVSFDAQMQAARSTLEQGQRITPSTVQNYRQSFGPVAISTTTEQSVSLDTEVAKLSENTLHHQTLLKALNRHFALLSTAVNEGKR